MRARALLLALLVLLASACGAHITIRSPLRVRLGRPTAAPTPTLLVVLPFTSTPEVAAVAHTAAAPAAVAPLASPSSIPTLRPSPSATVKRTEAATPTATETQAPPTPVEPTTTPSVVPDAATPSPGAEEPTAAPIATPPPRLPSAASAYAIRFHQLRFSVQGELVQIINRGPDQDLSGWRLVSAGADRAFAFPDGYILRQGETVTVH